MSEENFQLKKELRQQLRERKITIEERIQFSALACELLRNQPIWQNAKSILFYAPLPNEIDIWPLLSEALAADKLIALPRFDPETNSYFICQIKNAESDLQPGKFGIHEPKESCSPIPLNRLDLVLVPGVGFDPMGGRLGRGRGFYDRLLEEVSGKKCGVAFDEQMVVKVPMEKHDVRLNFILTPTRWLETR